MRRHQCLVDDISDSDASFSPEDQDELFDVDEDQNDLTEPIDIEDLSDDDKDIELKDLIEDEDINLLVEETSKSRFSRSGLLR
jgi:hypothetical protein